MSADPPNPPPSSGEGVGSFARKLDPREKDRLQAQIGNLKQQNAQFINDEKGQSRTLEKIGDHKTGEIVDLSKIPALYFKSCSEGNYIIDHRTTKVLIEDCHNCTFNFNSSVLTQCTEVWKCQNVIINSVNAVKTLQLDLSSGFTLNLPTLEQCGTIVWNSVEDLKVNITATPEHNIITGFKQMKELFPDSNLVLDQFIMRFLNNQIACERCIRLKNGFLSTEREAAEWDRRNDLMKERFIENFLKEGGITINKKNEKKSSTK